MVTLAVTAIAGLMCCPAGGRTFADEPTRPHVLFIMADDLNNSLGCYGHPLVRSPNIDRLAERGVRFDRAYCNYPVCNPSRTSLLSGYRPDVTGVVDNKTPPRTHLGNVVFLPQYFRQHGYRVLKVGKIFHTGDEFEDLASWDIDERETREAKNPPETQIVRRQGEGGIVLDAPDAETWDGHVARRAVELLEAAVQGDSPVFLAVGFRRPHTPYIAPRQYFDLYPPATIPLVVEPAEHLQHIPPLALTREKNAPPLADDVRRETTAAYYASISFMDAQLGLLWAALDRLDLWRHTVVVFVSDHGYHLGEHGGLKHKMTLFEEAARVPLLIAAPNSAAGVSTDGIVELVDLYPTLADLCGLPAPQGRPGTSLSPLVHHSPDEWTKQAAFTLVSRVGTRPATEPLDPDKLGRSVRTPRWRYTEWYDGTRELYDHEADPHEYRNLAADAQHAETIARLSALLASNLAGAPASAAP
ncbi:MAG: sulfatase [Pirellulales bacterium]|nr:sulfatase [Pirellulales bacterium]